MEHDVWGARVAKIVPLHLRLRLAKLKLASFGLPVVETRDRILLLMVDGEPCDSFDLVG